MTNSQISLDGTRVVQFDPQLDANATPFEEWRSIFVPSPWQALFDEMLKVL